MNLKERIEGINQGHKITITEGDLDLFEIWRIHNVFVVFSITLHGEAGFEKVYQSFSVQSMINEIESWT